MSRGLEVERVDGTQARLKPSLTALHPSQERSGGKGGWDSGEIETSQNLS